MVTAWHDIETDPLWPEVGVIVWLVNGTNPPCLAIYNHDCALWTTPDGRVSLVKPLAWSTIDKPDAPTRTVTVEWK